MLRYRCICLIGLPLAPRAPKPCGSAVDAGATHGGLSGRVIALLATLVIGLTLGAGCATEASDVHNITSKDDELASPLVERVIPLRFIQLQVLAGQADFVSYDAMRKRVQEANWTYKAAGVQFYISKWDKIVMPTFNEIDNEAIKRPWCSSRNQAGVCLSGVEGELRTVFPSLGSNAYPDNALLSETQWLDSAAAKAALRTEIIVWMPQTLPPLGFYWGAYPWRGGPDCMLNPGITWKFTHELGHVMGLQHTHDQWPNGNNPVSGAWNLGSDSWDLVYRPPSTTFASRAAAAAQESQLQLKNVEGPQNCNVDVNCTTNCNINGTNYSTGSPVLKGLAFTFAGDAPGSPHRGFNAMGYYGSDCAINGANGMGITDSQAVQIRRHLRYDTYVNNPSILVPSGLTIIGGRPRLRDWRGGASISPYLAEKLDLDGDNKRDIGVWQPPPTPAGIGTFTFLLSSKGYDVSQALIRSFGQMEDIPVMADYDGDNKTDIAVFHSGGITGSDPTSQSAYWKICESSTSFDCVNHVSVQWGDRTDVPMPGSDFDGDSHADLAVYRPSLGNWYWRTVTSGTWHTIYGNGPAEVSPLIQLPGLYDNDEATDLVTYNPANAQFSMLLSTTGWSQANQIVRNFPVTAVPLAYSGLYDAGGAVVSRRAQATRIICQGSGPWQICIPRTRRVLQIWEEWSGNWYTMWNPVSTSTLSTCQWGTALDVPLSGNIDRDGDGMSDYVVWRLSGSDSGGVLYFKNSASGTCSGATFSGAPGVPPFGTPSPRTQVFSAWDMSGDAKDEVMMLYPDTLWWWWINSNTYTSGPAVQLGGSGAVPL